MCQALLGLAHIGALAMKQLTELSVSFSTFITIDNIGLKYLRHIGGLIQLVLPD
jgi:hypothetical protein